MGEFHRGRRESQATSQGEWDFEGEGEGDLLIMHTNIHIIMYTWSSYFLARGPGHEQQPVMNSLKLLEARSDSI